jgi:hypothetical protein
VISFRYHMVTIVAIFLALALGVLAGTTVIRTGLVKTLKERTNQAEQQLADIQAQVDELKGFQAEALPWLTAHRLDGETVLLVTADGADPAGARNARQALTEAGAETVTLTVTSLITSPTRPTLDALADILGESRDTPSATLASDAATRLAERLAQGPPPLPTPSGGQAAGDDLLVSLIQQGFIRSTDVTPGDASTVGGTDQAVVVSAGGEGEPRVPIDTVMQRMVEQMVARTETVAAVQTSGTKVHPFVPLIREEADLPHEHLMTVDDVETPEGHAALVLGLRRMLDGATGGDYGTGEGAQTILPAVP